MGGIKKRQSMKKKIISVLLLSTVVLSSVAPVSGAVADTNSDIAKQDATISSAQSAKAQAQAQVDQLQNKVNALQSKQADAKNQLNVILNQAKQLNEETKTLNENIAERTDTLQSQARSAQVNSSATSYLNTILDSKSLTDAIQRITAMATMSNANQQMLEAQKKDQEALKQKSAEVQKNYSKYLQLSRSLDEQAKEITTQQAQLKVATLNYQATIETAQGRKAQLLAEKATAEKVAAEAAAKQAVYEQQQKASNEAQQKPVAPPVVNPGPTNPNPQPNPGPTPPPKPVTPPGNNPYAGGGCTDYVWQYFAAQGIYIGNIMPGNGGQWATNGPAQGILHVVGAAPGVIASGYSADFVGYAGSPYGHVAIVTAVHADGTFDVIEGGYSSGWWGHTRQNLSPAGVTFLYPNT